MKCHSYRVIQYDCVAGKAGTRVMCRLEKGHKGKHKAHVGNMHTYESAEYEKIIWRW